VPCRNGTTKAVQMLEAVEQGRLSADELEWLPQLAETLEQTSICGLGQVALNPILSMMKHFPEEVPGSGCP
jgi:NADH-quinone oxidoreductase subunit F